MHGSLNQIYADIKVECEKRGWDTVDAVILGGDTQVIFCLIYFKELNSNSRGTDPPQLQ